MRPYLAQIRSNLRLMGRDRGVLFFSVFFPMVFFLIFAFSFGGAKNPAAMSQTVAMVLILGVLGNGLFGAGMRAVQERETGILRRFKVAPVGAAPIIIASLVAGLVSYLPVIALVLVSAHLGFKMPYPQHLLDLLIFVSIGLLTFRAVGMIVAAVVNSAQESAILTQLLYLPMLFLSGATFPMTFFPKWLQTVAQFLPATYLHAGLQSILITGQGLQPNLVAAGSLIVAGAVAVFIGVKLFRWEKEEKISGRAKLWILVVLSPFLAMGVYQAKTQQNVERDKITARMMRRDENVLFQNVRIFVGNGKVIERGAVLIKAGKIDRVFDSPPAEPSSMNADIVESSGKTLLPGLIDMHVHLGAPGGVYSNASEYGLPNAQRRELAAYLYSGITAVRSTGDALDQSLALRKLIASGQYLGAELFVCGPMFTAEGGHGTEYGKYLPENMRAQFALQISRTPKSAAEARAQVDELKAKGVDGIKAILESGWSGSLFNHLDFGLYREIAKQAQADHLPLATHTGDVNDVRAAVEAGTTTIEHGSFRERIPTDVFVQMKRRGVIYDPTLAIVEAMRDLAHGKTDLLDRALVLQVGPPALLDQTKIELKKMSGQMPSTRMDEEYAIAEDNLKAAFAAGVTLVAGSDAGNLMVIHGPTIQRELYLWVRAGIPPAAAIQAATFEAAKALRADSRIGSIQPGREATFILVDGDPVQDISNLERVTGVVFKGEQVWRTALFEQDKKD
jgi:imidazolonepropionase-like amidohydrolase/ABC-type multidrug transport system permease subunit